MELDELKEVWAGYDRRLDLSIRLNESLLSAGKMSKAETAMRRFAMSIALEALAAFVVAGWLGSFIYEHAGVMRFALPAAALDVGAIAILISLVRALVGAVQIDYDEPVLTAQRQVELVRMSRIRSVQGIFLFATIAWVPLLIVTLQSFWGLDAYQLFSGGWLVANVILGLAMIPLGLWVSKRFGGRMGTYPAVRRFMNDLAGHSLNSAANALAGIAEFTR